MAKVLEPGPEVRAALEEAFLAVSRGTVSVPPRISAETAWGQLLAMPGHVVGGALCAKLVTVFPGSAPSHQGLLCLFDAEQGGVLAVMGAEHLTRIRTAAGSAMAADVCCPETARVLCIVGAGSQAEAHLAAFRDLRQWTEIRVWNRTAERARSLALADSRAKAVPELREALRGAEAIVLCTHGSEPLFGSADIAPGAHVSSVGIGRELPPQLLQEARVLVEWRGAAESGPPSGALDLESVDPATTLELGALLHGAELGREGPGQVTVYKSVGHSAEDCAVAGLAFRLARERSLGQWVEL
ncbi:MAG: alanine dehydrogenase [Planctomycetota bacterium]